MQRSKLNGDVVEVIELFIDGLQQTLAYNPDGTLNYVEAADGVNTWRQTYTYTGGKVTGISAWVKQ